MDEYLAGIVLFSVLLFLFSDHSCGVIRGINLGFSFVLKLINEQSFLVVGSMLLLHPVDLNQGLGK
jgi:hypothetical protein